MNLDAAKKAKKIVGEIEKYGELEKYFAGEMDIETVTSDIVGIITHALAQGNRNILLFLKDDLKELVNMKSLYFVESLKDSIIHVTTTKLSELNEELKKL